MNVIKLLALAIILMLSSVAHATLNDGLVAYWSFDDCTAKDNSGNGHDGTINGNPQCVNSLSSKGLLLNGNSDYVEIAGAPAFNSPKFSISIWASLNKLQPYSVGGANNLFNKENQYEAGIMTASGVIGFAIRTDSLPWTWKLTSFSPKVATPFFITLILYVNGQKYQEVIYNTGIITTTNCLRIGRRGCWSGHLLEDYFNGIVDEVRYYNRALTAAEVTALYQQETLIPTITNVTPKTTIIGSPMVFTVTGKNLTEGMGFTVGDCALSNNELPNGTTTKRQFLCTQYGNVGNKVGLIKTKPRGTKLFTFSVHANPDNIPEVYAATDKKELTSMNEIVSILFSTTVQNRLSTTAMYDLYVKFTLPDGTIIYDNGTQLVSKKTPFSKSMTFSQASDWSSLLKYSLNANAAAGTYIANIELWKANTRVALSTSATVFDYVPPATLATNNVALRTADNSTWLIKRGEGSQQKSSIVSGNNPVLNPTDLLKKYHTYCTQDPNSLECKDATRTVLALQLGTKYFEKIGGVDGIIGAYGIFKKGEKLAKNINEVNTLLDSYWQYQNNESLNNDQRILLVGMKVVNSLFADEMTSFVSLGDLADTLEKVLEKANKYDNSIAKAEGIATGFSSIDVIDDCFFGCKIKSIELTAVFTYIGAGYDDVDHILMKDLKKELTTEDNITEKTIIEKKDESSLWTDDYSFLGLPMGLYMVTVRYANGSVYRQPVHIDKAHDTYKVITSED